MPCLRPWSRLTASVAATALSVGLVAVTPGVARAEDKTTYLGLEGEGDPVAALSDALRWDLNQRGRDDGNTMSLAELELTMGCGDNDLACLAEGGRALGSKEFVFGTMTKDGASWRIQLQSLDIATGKLNNEIERKVSAADLGEGALAGTASSLIDELFGLAPKPGVVPVADGSGDGPTADGEGSAAVDPTAVDDPSDEPSREGALIWGPYSPRPTWKYVGVGVSGGLTLAALGTAIGTTVAIGPNGSIRKDLIAAAERSLTDNKPSNDVNPNTDGDLCPLAEAAPNPARPDEVANREMTEICGRANNLATTATISWIATGVFAASTVAFTTLLFVHKDKPAVAKLIDHDVGIGGAPLEAGGFVLGGSFRF